MTPRIAVAPEMLRWAVSRAGKKVEDFEHLPQWVAGTTQPTWRQLEKFAKQAHVPIGYLFLSEPPVEEMPLADFRVSGLENNGDQLDVLDVIYEYQRRQAWYAEYAERVGLDAVEWVGSASTTEPPTALARQFRDRLSMQEVQRSADNSTALREFRRACEDEGVLVMSSGVVGGNTHRTLKPGMLSGFSLADPYAPLIFLNSAESFTRRIFTLAHELGHLLLGQSAIDELGSRRRTSEPNTERWCNEFAGELLMPAAQVREVPKAPSPADQATQIGRRFNVSPLAALVRMRELRLVDTAAFETCWQTLVEESDHAVEQRRGGGDYYRSLRSRLGRRFGEALVDSVQSGETSERDAFRLTGVKKAETFMSLVGEERAS